MNFFFFRLEIKGVERERFCSTGCKCMKTSPLSRQTPVSALGIWLCLRCALCKSEPSVGSAWGLKPSHRPAHPAMCPAEPGRNTFLHVAACFHSHRGSHCGSSSRGWVEVCTCQLLALRACVILSNSVTLDVLNLSTSHTEAYTNQGRAFSLDFLQPEQWEQPHLPISSGPLWSHWQKANSISFTNVSRNVFHRAFPQINITFLFFIYVPRK